MGENMLSFIKGILSDIEDDRIVVENGGFGIEIYIPKTVFVLLPRIGEDIKVYTYFKVAEDGFSLYGFLNRGDLDIFKKLITVNSVGPKGALSILSTLSPEDLRLAILSEDEKAISKANGIGAKTAKRIILELKDKIDMTELHMPADASLLSGLSGDAVAEAIEALIALGYSQSQARKALKGIEEIETMSADKILNHALRNMI